jgi:hypothetical protein
MSFLVMLVLNFLTPRYGDDYIYFNPESIWRNVNFNFDYFKEQFLGYGNGPSDGRVVSKFLIAFSAKYLGVVGVRILNSINICLIGYVFTFLLNTKNYKIKILSFIIGETLFLIYCPVIGYTIFHKTNSIVYFLPFVFMMYFLAIYFRNSILIKKNISKKVEILLVIAMFLLGFIAHNNPIMICSIVACSIYCIFYRKKCRIYHFAGIFGGWLGFILYIISPATWGRMHLRNGYSPYHNPIADTSMQQDGIIYRIIKNATYMSENIIPKFMIPLIIFFILYITLTICDKKGIYGLPCKNAVILILSSIFNFLILLPIDTVESSVGFIKLVYPSFGMIIFAILLILKDLCKCKIEIGKLSFIFLTIFLLFNFIKILPGTTYNFTLGHNYYQQSLEQIKKVKNKGKKEIVLAAPLAVIPNTFYPYDSYSAPFIKWNPKEADVEKFYGMDKIDISTDKK